MKPYTYSNGWGEEIVLLHGWGMNSEVWQITAQHLAQAYHVHNVDLPGYGGSATIAPYTLPTLTAVIAERFSKPVHVIGWSLGGLIAMQWTLSQPENIKSLTLVASSPCFVQKEGWPFATPITQLQQFAAHLVVDYPGLIRRFLALQVKGSDKALQQCRMLEKNLIARGLPAKQVLLDGLAILVENDLRDQVRQITCPMLLQYGAKDLMTPLPVGEWLRATCLNAQLVVHPQAAHLPFLSHPTDFLNAQQRFLQSI
jgi:pimeloyl-[acyl-carrier protein] methyl ester esterase